MVTRERIAEHLRAVLTEARELLETVEGEWGESEHGRAIDEATAVLDLYDAERKAGRTGAHDGPSPPPEPA